MVIETVTMSQEKLTPTERLERSFIKEVQERKLARLAFHETFDPVERIALLGEIEDHTAEIDSILLEHLGNIAVAENIQPKVL